MPRRRTIKLTLCDVVGSGVISDLWRDVAALGVVRAHRLLMRRPIVAAVQLRRLLPPLEPALDRLKQTCLDQATFDRMNDIVGDVVFNGVEELRVGDNIALRAVTYVVAL